MFENNFDFQVLFQCNDSALPVCG